MTKKQKFTVVSRDSHTSAQFVQGITNENFVESDRKPSVDPLLVNLL